MKELQELLDFLKSKGHTNVKLPIDLWVSIIEYFRQKSNYSSGLSETQAVRQNEDVESNFICYHFESGNVSAKCHKPCGDRCCLAV